MDAYETKRTHHKKKATGAAKIIPQSMTIPKSPPTLQTAAVMPG
jgi:hypothetical protein